MYGLAPPSKNSEREPAMAGTPAMDPAAWYPKNMAALSHEWIYTLSDSQITDLMDAIKSLEDQKIDIKDITREIFYLPK